MVVGASFGLFVLCVVANILIKTYKNIAILSESFSGKKFIQGVVQMLVIGISSAILASVASIIPYVPVLSNMFETPEIKEIISIIVVVSIYFKSIVTYFTKSVTEINSVLNGANIVSDITSGIIE